MVRYLITGITGFFGRNFTKYLLDHEPESIIIGTAHSECKLAHYKKIFPKIKTYVIDLSHTDIENDIDAIIVANKIEYIIHSAAMKHVDICQENATMAYKVNVFGSEAIIRAAKRNNIVNLIALGTDKANNPCNTYGFVKKIMQDNVLSNGYSVYQGANFFGSDGSVIDIWFQQYMKNRPLNVRNYNHIRYFNTIDQVCEKIYTNLNTHGKIILPPKVYVIKLKTLLDAFCKYFNYNKIEYVAHLEYEKDIEILYNDIPEIKLDCDDVIPLIANYHNVDM